MVDKWLETCSSIKNAFDELMMNSDEVVNTSINSVNSKT